MSKYSSTKRVQEIELMKGIAIIGMVFVHILEGSIDYFTDAWTLPGSTQATLELFWIIHGQLLVLISIPLQLFVCAFLR